MRKIKTNKKDVEKKKKQISTLLTELLDTHMNKHDRTKTIKLTEEIMALNPTEPYPCEKVTSILVDINETDLRPITGLNIFYRKTLNAMRQVNCSPEEIIKVANQAVDEIPNDYYFRLERGLMFYLTKQLDKAKVDLKIAAKSSDQDIKSLAKSSLKMIGLNAEG